MEAISNTNSHIFKECVIKEEFNENIVIKHEELDIQYDATPTVQTRPLVQRLFQVSEKKKRPKLNEPENQNHQSFSDTLPFESTSVKIEPYYFEGENVLENIKTEEISQDVKFTVQEEVEIEIERSVVKKEYHKDDFPKDKSGNKKTETKQKRPLKYKTTTDLPEATGTIPYELLLGGPDRRRTVALLPLHEDAVAAALAPRATRPRGFSCPDCQQLLPSHAELRAHRITHQVETRHKCPACSKCFTRAHDLVLHERVHSGERPYICSFCDKGFTQKINMIRHVRIHTNERPFACMVCEERFIDQGDLAKHVRLHSGAQPHFCIICKERFDTLEEARQHTASSHQRNEPHTCTACPLSFADRHARRKHFCEVHSSEKPFQCHHCDKRFKLKVHLVKHMPVHTGIRAHACRLCGKRFSGETARRLHEVRHARRRAHACSLCNAAFHTAPALKRHAAVHVRARPYRCSRCDAAFKTHDARQRHIKVVHDRIHKFECAFQGCQETYSVKANMHRHMRSFHYGMKPYECKSCDAKFTSKSSLVAHTESRHPQ